MMFIMVFIIIFIPIGFFIVIYNMLVYFRNRIKQSLANIDVLLKQRNDEIDNLIRIVKGYSRYEIKVLENIAKLRSGFDPYMDVNQKDKFNYNMNKSLRTLFAIVENYPDIKADKQYMNLQHRITSLENQIADRREYYNWTVTNYNTRIKQIPYVIIASIFNFNEYELFKYL